jgi:hypothetical protein
LILSYQEHKKGRILIHVNGLSISSQYGGVEGVGGAAQVARAGRLESKLATEWRHRAWHENVAYFLAFNKLAPIRL